MWPEKVDFFIFIMPIFVPNLTSLNFYESPAGLFSS